MDTKLTLSLDKSVIEQAKNYAKSNKVSLSKLIESYLASLTSKRNNDLEIKKIAFTLLLALATTVTYAQTSTGDLTLSSQAAIDGFNFTEVTGTLTIEETTPGDIVNLDGLSELTTIGNELQIKNNTALTSFSGLEMLHSIGDTLTITGNTALTDFCVLSSLVGDDKQITSSEYVVSGNGYNLPYALVGNENFCSNVAGSIFDGDIILNSQEAIDRFNYTSVTGNLTINDSLNRNITNIDSLNELTQIGGNLAIQQNLSLISLSGLEDLTAIGGNLTIQSNTSLTSLSGLDSLTEIGGSLNIQTNVSLTSLRGLESLTEIGRNLFIIFNESLESLRGLDFLTEIRENLFIVSNDFFTSLSGLDSLTEIGESIVIQNNIALIDFCMLSPLVGDENQIISSEYNVSGNGYNPPYSFIQSETRCSPSAVIFAGDVTLNSQDTLDAFTQTYTAIIGNLTINDSLDNNITNLDNLIGLTEVVGNLSIQSNDSLTSLRGLDSLIGVGGNLEISTNVALTDFCAISSLVGNDLPITSGDYTVSGNSYNPPYTFIQIETLCSNVGGSIFAGDVTLNSQDTLDVFTQTYTAITGNLIINDSLDNNITNLDSLIGLTEVGGNLSIQSNASLTSLSGLDSLTEIGGNLEISTNIALADFCAISSLVGNEQPITSEDYTVSDNSYNPPYTFIQIETLCSNVGGSIFAGDVTLNSQDTLDVFTQTYTAIRGNLIINDSLDNNITNLDSLIGLTEVGGNLRIQSNSTLESLRGLDSLTEVGGNLSIQINSSLESLRGLESLTEVGGNLSIQINSSLESLRGLDSLTEIGGFLSIRSNSSLESLRGLDSLIEIGGLLDIQGNISLTNFCVLSPLVGNDQSINFGEYFIFSNGYNPTYTEIQTSARCHLAPPVVVVALQDVTIELGDLFAPINLASVFSDPNGEPLTYTATSSDTAVVKVSITEDSTLTLTEVGVGTTTITVTATAGEASINSTFMASITQNNNAPIRTTLAFPPIPAVEVGYQLPVPINLTPFFSDPDGDGLMYTATASDTSIITVEIVQPSSVTFTALSVGTTAITITATDPHGLSVSETVMLTVEEGEAALGIADTDILAVYPNPSSGVFQLSRTAAMVWVYDMSGRLVYRGRKIKDLDLTSNPAGQYLVEVRVGKERGRYTIIRE